MQPDETPRPDYNFILNPQPAPKQNIFNSGNFKQRLLIVCGGAVVLMILISVVSSLLLGSGSGNVERLVGVVNQQQELARVAALGEKDAVSVETKNYAATVNLSLTSARTDTTALLAKLGKKLENKELGLAKDVQTDDALTKGGQINRYDETFNQIIKASLEKYQQLLGAAFDAAGTKAEKTLLQQLFNSAQTLINTVPGN